MIEQTITIQIIVQKPVAGLLYGLQKGSGNDYETVQKQLAAADDLCFEIPLPVKENKSGDLVFYGPFAQGPANEKFLYIDIGSYAGQVHTSIGGRMKVPLPNLSERVKQGPINGIILSARFPGQKEKGGTLNTGTVKPLGGW